MSAPVLRWLFIAQGTTEVNSCPSPTAARSSAIRSEERSAAPAQRKDVERGPLCPALRAIPFPKVTELFCRLPSATLFYRPEAANLGDLMRLWVRARVRINLSLGFSRAAGSSPNSSQRKELHHPLFPTSRQDDSRDHGC